AAAELAPEALRLRREMPLLLLRQSQRPRQAFLCLGGEVRRGDLLLRPLLRRGRDRLVARDLRPQPLIPPDGRLHLLLRGLLRGQPELLQVAAELIRGSGRLLERREQRLRVASDRDEDAGHLESRPGVYGPEELVDVRDPDPERAGLADAE